MDMKDWFMVFAVLGPLLGVFVPLIIHLNNRMDKKFEILMARMDHKMDHLEQKIESTHKELDYKIENTQKCLEQKIDHLGERVGKVETRLSIMEVEIKNTNQRLTDFQGQMNQRLSTIEGYLVPKKVFRFEEPHHDPDEPKEN